MGQVKKETNFKYSHEQDVIACANTDANNLAQKIDSQIGLSNKQRKLNEQKFGVNKIIVKKFRHWKKLLEVILEPLNLLLLAIGLTEFLIYFLYSNEVIDLISGFIIIFMIFLAGSVDYTQEYKAYRSNLELHKMVQNSIWVLKEQLNFDDFQNIHHLKNKFTKLDQSDLTIGDVIYLTIGDVIPTDVRILWVKDLIINESNLTGESEAIFKKTTNHKTKLLELENIGFGQTIINNGSCIAVVINIAEQTYATSILKIAEEQETESDYEKGVAKITKILVIAIISIILIILIAAGLRTGDWIRALIFALSIAVSLTPESLPAIISSNLQLGAKKLAKQKVVIKNLGVLQNMGSVDVLCTDKTGTLTIDEIELHNCVDINGQSSDNLNQLLLLNASYQINLSNKMDQGIINKLNKKILQNKKIKFINEAIFSHTNRLSSVLLEVNQQDIQISKGSVDEMLKMISFINDNGTIKKLDQQSLQKIKQQVNKLISEGYRTLVIGSKQTSTLVSEGLVFEGIASFAEVVKPWMKEVISFIYEHNIDLKLLTGDASDISCKIASLIDMKNIKSITGEEIQKLNQKELHQLLDQINIFAKLSPLDKATIVKNLQDNNKVVAFLGDGVNDAPALKLADVGISVNNGTPLAKVAADVILLEKDLYALEKAFVKGRQIFVNAIKYINITVACNLGLMLTLLISTLWFKFEVMSPLQLLLQNLIYDFSNLIFVFDKVDNEAIKKPLSWNAKSIIPFAFWNGLVATLVSIINFLIIGFGLNMFNEINVGNDFVIKQFQTIFFLESLFTHMMLIIIFRTEKLSLIQSWPSWQLVCGMSFFIGIAFLLTYVHEISHAINFEKPNSIWLAILVGLLFLAWILGELSKKLYIKIFKKWF